MLTNIISLCTNYYQSLFFWNKWRNKSSGNWLTIFIWKIVQTVYACALILHFKVGPQDSVHAFQLVNADAECHLCHVFIFLEYYVYLLQYDRNRENRRI